MFSGFCIGTRPRFGSRLFFPNRDVKNGLFWITMKPEFRHTPCPIRWLQMQAVRYLILKYDGNNTVRKFSQCSKTKYMAKPPVFRALAKNFCVNPYRNSCREERCIGRKGPSLRITFTFYQRCPGSVYWSVALHPHGGKTTCSSIHQSQLSWKPINNQWTGCLYLQSLISKWDGCKH